MEHVLVKLAAKLIIGLEKSCGALVNFAGDVIDEIAREKKDERNEKQNKKNRY